MLGSVQAAVEETRDLCSPHNKCCADGEGSLAPHLWEFGTSAMDELCQEVSHVCTHSSHTL